MAELDVPGSAAEALNGAAAALSPGGEAGGAYLSLNDLRRALMRYELYQRIRTVKGSILECGVRDGRGVRDWALLTQIFDAYDHSRRIVGFDTFTGFPSIHPSDVSGRGRDPRLHVGGMALPESGYASLVRWIERFDSRRPLAHVPKIELVSGDACETIPSYVAANPHLVVALLFLDFDVYAPTRAALEHLVPRMPRGALLVFDELNQPDWPGETLALLERFDLRDLRLEQLPWEPNVAFARIGE